MKDDADDLLPFALAEVVRVGSSNRGYVREGRIKVGDKVFLVGTDNNCRSKSLDHTWGSTDQSERSITHSYRIIARFDQED